ncbi:uncharacterized protein LOC103515632 [Diaphorina citri]|uniref:Uncharacterized protein LOC103515632 n=1 Tax=Diaphorina citri TaxID=121845 RepID=A0A3Q0J6H9_DIACI|nr:uncharacterized protein LOC103515632 [Diaphorina citri]
MGTNIFGVNGTSSTGRISTGSGTSLGDSGTHSDHEDRKITETHKGLHAASLTPNNHHFYSDIPFIPKPMLTKSLSMDEYKHMEKRALCTSCHDYTNLRAPLLRGNSYQEDPIAEEDNPAGGNEVAIAEVHNTVVHNSTVSHEQGCNHKENCNCGTSEKSSNECNKDIGVDKKNISEDVSFPLPPVEIKINVADTSNETQVIPVSIEMSDDIQLSKPASEENKDLNDVTSDHTRTNVDSGEKELKEEIRKEEYNITCNGKHRDAFVIEAQTKESAIEDKSKVEETKQTETSQETNDNNAHADIKTVISKINKDSKNKVHELANMFEHVEDLNKTKVEQEDLDNSFEKEFKNSCKEIKNIARNSLIKNVSEDFELNKELEPLKRYDSESTLQLSDVETESIHSQQYDVSSYVNINTCRTTNL